MVFRNCAWSYSFIKHSDRSRENNSDSKGTCVYVSVVVARGFFMCSPCTVCTLLIPLHRFTTTEQFKLSWGFFFFMPWAALKICTVLSALWFVLTKVSYPQSCSVVEKTKQNLPCNYLGQSLMFNSLFHQKAWNKKSNMEFATGRRINIMF